ncbi:MarR family winged helix-turn-helix transcriptional regulator [Catenisphaera adipataccumulans]|uniref:MarR family 2-MHQ and catechol resistance regulon transcriptional repressor n=1 Tax=Catenisphaera adipataccumulans TaxID=700500 RepID=A0A7W8FV26_9FIRM|nr:MarR family winged helix-turn-helix transcriptional regulator [Catenisphaera adipataccumulans]MBB5182708.1 MarR family 2-MHQ and catechol resistance regulon transcriptional repressor [Catenisphaera adipataccumulans]
MQEDNYILIKMHRINSTIDRKTAHIAAQYGLTLGQFGVLEALYHAGDLTVGEVKEKILSTDGTIPVVVRNLVKCDLIRQRKDENDGRRHILSLTDKGREVIAKAYPENAVMIEQEMQVWNEEEKQTLVRLFKKFAR